MIKRTITSSYNSFQNNKSPSSPFLLENPLFQPAVMYALNSYLYAVVFLYCKRAAHNFIEYWFMIELHLQRQLIARYLEDKNSSQQCRSLSEYRGSGILHILNPVLKVLLLPPSSKLGWPHFRYVSIMILQEYVVYSNF